GTSIEEDGFTGRIRSGRGATATLCPLRHTLQTRLPEHGEGPPQLRSRFRKLFRIYNILALVRTTTLLSSTFWLRGGFPPTSFFKLFVFINILGYTCKQIYFYNFDGKFVNY